MCLNISGRMPIYKLKLTKLDLEDAEDRNMRSVTKKANKIAKKIGEHVFRYKTSNISKRDDKISIKNVLTIYINLKLGINPH